MSETIEMVYECEVFGKIFRVYGTVENPLFLAKDVAEWIDYAKTGKGVYNISMMLQSVDSDEKLMSTILVSGQNREMWFLTEQGLYELLMQSRKPIAKQFKSKVKAILKEIRLTGGYISSAHICTDTDIDIDMPDFRNPVESMRCWLYLRDKYVQLFQKYRNLSASSSSHIENKNVDIGTLANIMSTDNFKITRNQIYKWLRIHNYVIRQEKYMHVPIQEYIDAGLFVVEHYMFKAGYQLQPTVKIYVTPKGQKFFIDAIKQDLNKTKLITVHSKYDK